MGAIKIDDTKDFFKELISIVLVALVMAMLLRTFIVEGRVIPSGSMLPTIQLQDRVMVNKFIYYFKKPQRGDIIVFQPPLKSSEDYIKRLIGLPGDKVEVRDSIVFINDQPLNEPYINEPPNYNFGPTIVPQNSLFVMGDNRNSSFDSHLWNAWLTQDKVKGKAFFRYWPPSRMGVLK